MTTLIWTNVVLFGMLIANYNPIDEIVIGPEVGGIIQPGLINEDHFISPDAGYSCVICGQDVDLNRNTTIQNPLEYFRHKDGTEDCLLNRGTSKEHRIAIEVIYKEISNLVRSYGIVELEKWVGNKSHFVIADVRVGKFFNFCYELFYASSSLGLKRRLETMFDNDYKVYLIFREDSRINPDRVEHCLQKFANKPIQLGRFDPATLELDHGTQFSAGDFDFQSSDHNRVPKYIL